MTLESPEAYQLSKSQEKDKRDGSAPKEFNPVKIMPVGENVNCVTKPCNFEKRLKYVCTFGCMGKYCKHENWLNCANPAIKGLHSEWVMDLIIGSQRLSDRLI